MSIIKKEFIGLICDGCQTQYSNCGDLEFFDSIDEVVMQGEDNGWECSENADLCESCKDLKYGKVIQL